MHTWKTTYPESEPSMVSHIWSCKARFPAEALLSVAFSARIRNITVTTTAKEMPLPQQQLVTYKLSNRCRERTKPEEPGHSNKPVTDLILVRNGLRTSSLEMTYLESAREYRLLESHDRPLALSVSGEKKNTWWQSGNDLAPPLIPPQYGTYPTYFFESLKAAPIFG